eukprot:Opistho-2@91318
MADSRDQSEASAVDGVPTTPSSAVGKVAAASEDKSPVSSKQCNESTPVIPRVFMRSLAFIYLAAFASLYVQLPGLYGRNGILPVESLLRRRENGTAFDPNEPLQSKMYSMPTLLWITRDFGITTEAALDMVGRVCVCVCVEGESDLTCVELLSDVVFRAHRFEQRERGARDRRADN